MEYVIVYPSKLGTEVHSMNNEEILSAAQRETDRGREYENKAINNNATHNVLKVKYQQFHPFSDDTIETTGAGDTFGACIIHHVLESLIFSVNSQIA